MAIQWLAEQDSYEMHIASNFAWSTHLRIQLLFDASMNQRDTGHPRSTIMSCLRRELLNHGLNEEQWSALFRIHYSNREASETSLLTTATVVTDSC